jgi:hypothetical protein
MPVSLPGRRLFDWWLRLNEIALAMMALTSILFQREENAKRQVSAE